MSSPIVKSRNVLKRNSMRISGSKGLFDKLLASRSFVAHIPVRIEHVRPYALAGAGALVFDPTDRVVATGIDRQTKATFVYGGGVNFDLTRNFSVGAEYRGLVYKVPDFTLNLNLDKVTHLAQPSVGFFFRF